MPFRSEKQRKYLYANEPKVASKWSEKYGSKVKKKGILAAFEGGRRKMGR